LAEQAKSIYSDRNQKIQSILKGKSSVSQSAQHGKELERAESLHSIETVRSALPPLPVVASTQQKKVIQVPAA